MTRTGAHDVRLARAIVGLLASAALAGLSILAMATTAAAHASQTGAEPAAGSVLASAPSKVVITFDAALMDVGAALVVRDAEGTDVTGGPTRLRANTIAVPLRTDLGPGTYDVAYRVVSVDGHTVTAGYTFTVTGSAETSPTPALPSRATVDATPDATPADVPSTLSAGGILAVAMAAIVVVGGVIAVRRRR